MCVVISGLHAAVRIVPKAASSNVTKPPLFYISQSLFQNKRLKRRRRIRLKKLLNAKTKPTKVAKTDVKKKKKKKKLSNLVADVTIDLLSDEEPPVPTPPPIIMPIMTNNDESIIITSDSEVEEPPKSSSSPNKIVSLARKIYPIEPDETVVQTEIGNRVYEMPLNKLREGLDLNIPNDGKSVGKRKKNQQINSEPPLVPISLHLSKNLSISLVSEDEDDQEEFIDLRNDSAMPPITHISNSTAVAVGHLTKCKLG